VSRFGSVRYSAIDSLYFPESYNALPLAITSEALMKVGSCEKTGSEIISAAITNQKRVILNQKNGTLKEKKIGQCHPLKNKK